MNKLCGTLFIRNGIEFDYCFKESIQCLLEFCDYVIVVDAGSDDGTLEELQKIDSPILKIISLPKSDWENQHGKEKLNFFTNVAIQEADRLGFTWNFNLQSDEIVHEDSYAAIREAIQYDHESIMCTRVNLWKSPYLQLNVPHSRMPCSSQILRLAKTSCRSYGDAESLQANTCTFDYVEKIRIYHMGFVRKKEVMKSKIINMQENIFNVPHDIKLDMEEVFNPDLWFNPEIDLKPITEKLPKIIEKWAQERV